MALEILVTTRDPEEGSLILPSDRELLDMLGPKDQIKQATLYISELLGRLFEEVRQSIDFECTVEVTVSGSLTLKGSGELKYLILNVGGEANTQTTMKVKLATKVTPIPM